MAGFLGEAGLGGGVEIGEAENDLIYVSALFENQKDACPAVTAICS